MANEDIDIEVKSNLGEVAQGVDGVQKAMGALGVESEVASKSMEGLQSAMNFKQGITQVTRLGKVVRANTTIQKLWNLAMKANPIGLLIAAVTTLIAGIAALVFWLKKSSEQAKLNTELTEANTKAIEEQTKALDKNSAAFGRKQKQQLAMAKASGESAEAIRELELKLIDEKIAFIASEEAIAKETLAKQKNVLATLQARDAEEDLIAAQTKNVDQAEANLNKVTQSTEAALIERIDLNNRHLVEIRQAETEAARQRAADRKAEREKEIEEQKEYSTLLDNMFEQSIDKRIELIEKLNKAEDVSFEKKKQIEMSLQELSENRIEWEAMTQNERLNLTKNTLNNLAAIAGEESKAGKALAITATTIDTFQAAQAAYKSMAGIPVIGPALGGIAAAAAVAAGMKNIQAIKSASSAGVSGGGGISSTAPARPAPQMMSGAFDISGGIEPEATRAYVVTDEMTNSQNQLANIRRRATI
jgi:hypothetical protein